MGDKHWWLNGKCHREDGPAIEWTNGDKYWYQHGLLHRVDGPAVEYASGNKEWCLYGKDIDCNTNEEFLRIVKLKTFW